MRRYGHRQKNSVMYDGHRLVRLQERFVRDAIRVYRDGHRIAVIQKNGNIGMAGTGIFDDDKNLRAQLAVAQMLEGLKIAGPAYVQAHHNRLKQSEDKRDVASLADEAERLGYKIVQVMVTGK